MEQQREAEALGGARANRHYNPRGGERRPAREAHADLFGDGRIRDMERIYRLLEQGRYPEEVDDKFTLDEAFLFAEENIH